MDYLKLNLAILPNWLVTESDGISTSQNRFVGDFSYAMTLGSGSGQADQLYVASGVISGSGSVDIDLYSGIENPFGTEISFDSIKYMVLANPSGSDSLYAGMGAASGFSGWLSSGATEEIKPGGVVTRVDTNAGWAVTSTERILTLSQTGSGSVSYYLAAIGVEA